MCFRPAEISADVHCPNCGKKINKTQGLYPKKCPFCKTVFAEVGFDPEEAAANAIEAAAAAPAPMPPTAPSPIAPPPAPAAPKPPVE